MQVKDPQNIGLRDSIEHFKTANARMIQAAAQDQRIQSQALRSAMENIRDAIKSCLLINIGAAGALLVFIGNIATVKDKSPANGALVLNLAFSFYPFIAGAVAAIAA